MLPDALAARGGGLQGPDGKAMSKLMKAGPSTALRLEPRRFQQGAEHVVNFPVHQRLAVIRNEEVVTPKAPCLALLQVAR